MPNIVDRVQANHDNIAALTKGFAKQTDKVLTIIEDLTSQVKKLTAQVDTQKNDLKFLEQQRKASVQYHKLNDKRTLDTIEKLRESLDKRFVDTARVLAELDRRIEKLEEKQISDVF